MQTQNGIFLNLKESTFKTTILNDTFYFSSQLYLNRFKDGVADFVELEAKKLEIKYKVPLYIERYLNFVFYQKIEKRGFRIIIEDSIFGKSELLHLPKFEVVLSKNSR